MKKTHEFCIEIFIGDEIKSHTLNMRLAQHLYYMGKEAYLRTKFLALLSVLGVCVYASKYKIYDYMQILYMDVLYYEFIVMNHGIDEIHRI